LGFEFRTKLASIFLGHISDRFLVLFLTIPPVQFLGATSEHLNGPRRESILKDQPLGRVTEPDEVARTVEFCALDAPLSMTGSIIDVNGASYLRT